MPVYKTFKKRRWERRDLIPSYDHSLDGWETEHMRVERTSEGEELYEVRNEGSIKNEAVRDFLSVALRSRGGEGEYVYE